MILCLGTTAERTFDHTVRALREHGLRPCVVEIVPLIANGGFDVPVDDLSRATLWTGKQHIVLGDVASAYLRIPELASAAPSEELREASVETCTALNRLFTHVDIPMINPPLRECSNFAKVFHSVRFAPVAEWKIPRSCLTNEPGEAQAFVDSCKSGVIVKGASSTKTWASVYEAKDAARLQLVRKCPTLFQERISGPDVRVHIVGERIIAEQIISASADYRTGRGNGHQAIEVPPGIAAGATRLVRETGVPFLGIDFKIDSVSGDWYFLEANSRPGYEPYDRRADGAISKALAEWLSDPPPIEQRQPRPSTALGRIPLPPESAGHRIRREPSSAQPRSFKEPTFDG